MEGQQLQQRQCSWRLSDNKTIKLFQSKFTRVAFQKTTQGKPSRGLSISKEAFCRLHNMTTDIYDALDYKPKSPQVQLDDNVFLIFYSNHVKLTRYCTTRDNKKCDAAFFIFNGDEWVNFLDIIVDVMNEINR